MLKNFYLQRYCIILLCLLSFSCAQQKVFFVAGTVELQNAHVLPSNSIIEIVLADVSLADAPRRVITKKTINNATELPIHFSIEYDPLVILPGHSYALSARIESINGKLLWINDVRYSVLNTKNMSLSPPENKFTKMILKKVN